MSQKKQTVFTLVGIMTVLVIVAGLFSYTQLRPKPDEVLFTYIKNGLETKEIASEQTGTGTGVEMSLKGSLDIPSKKLLLKGDVSCVSKASGEEIKIVTTVQQENDTLYIKLNKAQGTYVNDEGESFDLSKVWAPAVGKWYIMQEDEETSAAQLDAGVFASNSILMAPTYDSEEIAKEIIESKVFSYKSYRIKDNNYVYQFVADKNAYVSLLKNKFPNVKNADLIIENIFGDKSSVESELILNKKGVFVKENMPLETVCTDMFSIFADENAGDFVSEIGSTSNLLNEVDIEKVTDPQPFDTLYDSMAL